ncbi:MAG: efflux RND transporter periplasmic adaptor subunit [Paraclostridium sp.]
MKKINLKTKGKKLGKNQKVVAGIVSVVIAGQEKIFMTGEVVPGNLQEIFVESDQGKLDSIKVVEGQYVEKGQVLFTCKNEEQIKEIATLNTELANKKKEKQNAPDEESKKIVEEEIKNINTQIGTLNKTAYQTVYAPFSGTVYLTKQSVGGEGTSSVLTIETTNLYVDATVNERDSYRISKNQKVELTSLATKEKYDGTISKIGNRPIEGGNEGYGSGSGMSQYPVEICLDSQENLKNGIHMQIVALHGEDYKKIPTSAIKEENGKTYVFVIEGSTAYKKEVKIIESGNEITVVEGKLKENDMIAKDLIYTNIEDGDRVYTQEDLDK